MNSIFALNTDNKDRINRYDCVENMMVGNVRAPLQTRSSVPQLASIQVPLTDAHHNMTLHPFQSRAVHFDLGLHSDPNLLDARTLTTQLFDLLVNHVGFPDQSSSDALEPTPIREGVTSSSVRIIDTSHLDSLKGASCDGMRRQNSFSDAAEASNLFNFFTNDHQANTSIQYHAENTLARFSAAVDAAIVTFGVRKVNSFPKVRKASSCHQVATSSRVPKRRRISDDIKAPSFRKYQEIHWMEQFRELKKLKEQHGQCLINFKKLHQENKVLSRWIKRQRYQYKLKMTGKVSTMTDARIKMLEDIGFVWNSRATIWDKRFELIGVIG